MERGVRNTRAFVRYRSAIGTRIYLSPEGVAQQLNASLLDINRAGGMGVFVPLKGNLETLFLSTAFMPWEVRRETRTGLVSLKSRVYNGIPLFSNREAGVRMALLHVGSGKDWTSGEPRRRRISERNKIEPKPVILTRRNMLISGTLDDVSQAGGAGIRVLPDGLGNATYGELFGGMWRLEILGRSFQCEIKRFGMEDSAMILGAVAPGISEDNDLTDALNKDGFARLGDDALISFLEDFMKDNPEFNDK